MDQTQTIKMVNDQMQIGLRTLIICSQESEFDEDFIEDWKEINRTLNERSKN